MNKEELEEEIIELNKDIEFRQKVIDSLLETKKMYRERIDKAIEYIEDIRYFYRDRLEFKEYYKNYDRDIDNILHILKGGKNDK